MQAIFGPKNQLNWVLQEFAGPDARDFLNRMTTVNVQRLQPHEGALGFFLSATGKIRAQFFLGCVGEDRFVFEYDAGKSGEWMSALSETIEQFTFAERQKLSSPSNQECIWVLLGSGSALPGREALAGCLILDHGSRDFGLSWLSVWGDPQQIHKWQAAHLSSAEQWDWALLNERRIAQIRPWVDHEITSEVMPLELGLYDGITEGKGCYPGQEVIERVISQGAPPRRLVLVSKTAQLTSTEGAPQLAASSWSGEKGLVLVRKSMASVGEKLSVSQHGEVVVMGCSPGSPESQL